MGIILLDPGQAQPMPINYFWISSSDPIGTGRQVFILTHAMAAAQSSPAFLRMLDETQHEWHAFPSCLVGAYETTVYGQHANELGVDVGQ